MYGFVYVKYAGTECNEYSCFPVLSCVSKNKEFGDRTYIFTPYKKGTHEKRKSGSVGINTRLYADIYEEAVEMYNKFSTK